MRQARVQWSLALLLVVGVLLLLHRSSLSYLFSSEDWTVVGPPAVKRFLDDPFSLFGFLAGGHYNPLSRAFFTLESLLFREHPLGYHLVSLALLSSLSLLLLRFLRAFGVGFPAALLASLCFAGNWMNIHLVMQVYNQHYFLLNLLLLASLLCFKSWLSGGNRKSLAWTAVLAGAAQWVHSTAVILPAFLLVLLLLPPPREEEGGTPPGPRERLLALLGLGGVVVILQGAPRLFLGLHLEGVGASPALNLPGFLDTLVQLARIWWVRTRDFIRYLFPAGAWLIPALAALAILAWGRRPRHLPLLLLGLAMMAFILAPAIFVLNWPPAFFASRLRYMFLTATGATMVLAVLFEALIGGIGGKGRVGGLLRQGGRVAAAGLAVLYLAASAVGITSDYLVGRGQSLYLHRVVGAYRETAAGLARETPCRKIRIGDVALERTAPNGIRGGILVQGLDHKTLHDFYFALDQAMLDRFEFFEPPPGNLAPRGPCEFTLVEGRAI